MIDRSSLIIPSSLGGGQQANISLGYFLTELQPGSVVQGSVSSIDEDGRAIISTKYGKFSIDNLFDLHKGDKISLTISTTEERLLSTITLINDLPSKSVEQVELQFTSKPSPTNVTQTANPKSPIQIDISNIPTTQHNLKATLNYLNLSNLNKNSIPYKIWSDVKSGSTVEFKVVKETNEIFSPYQITGEIIEDSSDKTKQLIKTSFGILSTDNANIHVGKKLTLEIKSVNNIDVTTKLNILSISDFMFKLNNNWSALKQLSNIFVKLRPKSNKSEFAKINMDIDDSDPVQNIKDMITKFMNPFINKQEIKTLSENLSKLKELYGMQPPVESVFTEETELGRAKRTESINTTLSEDKIDCSKHVYKPPVEVELGKGAINIKEDSNNWISFFIPIFDGEKIINNKILIRRRKDQILRFIIEMSLEQLGEIQIDGYVKLSVNNIPESFDLILKFKDSPNNMLQNKISEMFLLHQNLSGIRGSLNFKQVKDFKIVELV